MNAFGTNEDNLLAGKVMQKANERKRKMAKDALFGIIVSIVVLAAFTFCAIAFTMMEPNERFIKFVISLDIISAIILYSLYADKVKAIYDYADICNAIKGSEYFFDDLVMDDDDYEARADYFYDYFIQEKENENTRHILWTCYEDNCYCLDADYRIIDEGKENKRVKTIKKLNAIAIFLAPIAIFYMFFIIDKI